MLMTTEEKLAWLTNDFIQLLFTLKNDATGNWGVLNAQQMVEHLSDAVRQANGKVPKTLLTPSEHLEKVRSFMLSEKPFRENTKNSEMPDEPQPVRLAGMSEAILELKQELASFIDFYKDDDKKELMNPFFGALNFEQWTHLLHKHARHHARQFNLIQE